MKLFKIFSIRNSLILISFGIILVLLLLISFGNLKQSYVRVVNGQEAVVFGLPISLKIPKININSKIEYVGLTSGGAMDVPKGPANVAWFNLGTHPGDIGSAVLAGHSGWKDGIPAVFDNLSKLKKGDKIYIKNKTGDNLVFIVREIKRYDPKADATLVFTSTDGKAHVNLIACTGTWDTFTKSHSQRLVVFTDKE